MPGGTVAWVTRRLGLEAAEPPAPQAVLAIESRLPLEGELLSFYIDEALVVAGVSLDDLDFPEGASVALIVRGDRLIAAQGHHGAAAGRPRLRDRPGGRAALIQLMFGRPEEE